MIHINVAHVYEIPTKASPSQSMIYCRGSLKTLRELRHWFSTSASRPLFNRGFNNRD